MYAVPRWRDLFRMLFAAQHDEADMLRLRVDQAIGQLARLTRDRDALAEELAFLREENKRLRVALQPAGLLVPHKDGGKA